MDKTALTIIGISMLIGLSPVLVEYSSVNTSTIEFKANATVIDQTPDEGGNLTLGVNAEREMAYGEMPINVSTTKILNMTASDGYAYLVVSSNGNISEKLFYNKYNYFNGSKEFNMRFKSGQPGFYSGTVRIKTMTPRNELGAAWLDLKRRRLLSF